MPSNSLRVLQEKELKAVVKQAGGREQREQLAASASASADAQLSHAFQAREFLYAMAMNNSVFPKLKARPGRAASQCVGRAGWAALLPLP